MAHTLTHCCESVGHDRSIQREFIPLIVIGGDNAHGNDLSGGAATDHGLVLSIAQAAQTNVIIGMFRCISSHARARRVAVARMAPNFSANRDLRFFQIQMVKPIFAEINII